jgi:hypothetical protein
MGALWQMKKSALAAHLHLAEHIVASKANDIVSAILEAEHAIVSGTNYKGAAPRVPLILWL